MITDKRGAPAQLQEWNAAQVFRTGGSICLQTHRRCRHFTEVRQNRGRATQGYNSGNSGGITQPMLISRTAVDTPMASYRKPVIPAAHVTLSNNTYNL